MSSGGHLLLGAGDWPGLPQTLLILLGSYLVGSIPFGLLAGKMKGIDIRAHGSGNIGATNVSRTLGKGLGFTVFGLDFLKGFVPVWAASALTSDASPLPLLAAICAVLGHNYPLWLQFKGGKGIATSGGALVGVLPWAVLAAVLTWLVTFVTTRYVSVASMAAAVAIPVTTGVLFAMERVPATHFLFALFIAALAIWRHRGNIQRLRDGTENKFERGQRRKRKATPRKVGPRET